jgi:hypothetical protein
MKRASLLFLLTTFWLIAFCTSKYPLSTNSKISLLTCGDGDAVYSSFGHSGIRVVDKDNNCDLVFNYGAFSYSTSEFYRQFIKGELNFYLVIVPTSQFIQEYKEENRIVTETSLNLDVPDKQKIFDYLLWNAEASNAAYPYHFLYNNCSSRIIQLFESNLDSTFSFNFDTVRNESYRRRGDEKLSGHSWVKLFLALVMGVEADNATAEKQACYLPTNLLAAFHKATISGKFLANQDNVILQSAVPRLAEKMDEAFVYTTLVLAGIMLLLFSSNMRAHQIVTGFLLLMLGAIGMLLVTLFFSCSFTAMQRNYNLLWALPLDIIAAGFIFKRDKAWAITYLRYYGMYLFLLVPAFLLLPQQFYFGLYLWCPLLGFYFLKVSQKLANQGDASLR